MPKQKYIIRDFSGGMNTKRDPRDLDENESSFINNMSIDGSTNLSKYIVASQLGLEGGGGYGVFYFESDHGRDSTNTITKTIGATSLVIGTSNGNILFGKVDSLADEQADQDVYNPQ